MLLTVILFGLSGCSSSRTAVKTETEKQIRKTEVTDSSRTETTTTRDQLSGILASNEQHNVVIEFEEVEYYQPNDTATGENYAQERPENIREGNERYEPPNAGAVKKIRKGTITISGKKETTETKEQVSETGTSIQETGNRETTLKEDSKEQTQEKKGRSKAGLWLVAGLFCAALFVGLGIYIARKF